MGKLRKWLAIPYKVIASLYFKLRCKKALQFRGLISVRMNGKINCRRGGTIFLEPGVATRQNVLLAAVDGGHIHIGEKTFLNRNVVVVCRDSVRIGDHCSFGPNVCIYDHDHKFDRQGVTGDYKTGAISIGNNCWIGAGCVILRGTNIGDGCVIGAGAVVSGEIPAHSIVKMERNLIIKEIQ